MTTKSITYQKKRQTDVVQDLSTDWLRYDIQEELTLGKKVSKNPLKLSYFFISAFNIDIQCLYFFC